jgi:tetrathionate reductase subunit B
LQRGEEPACVETCPTKARVFGDLNDPQSKVSAIMKREKLVQVVNPMVNTQPAIYYLAGALPLDWPAEPTLPGNVHMNSAFWKTTK